MGRLSKFKVGDKVKCSINELETYEVIEVLRNELRVKALESNLKFTCKKSIFKLFTNN